MQDQLSCLVEVLQEKSLHMEKLLQYQEAFKAFLIKPRWHRFFQVTRPMEACLAKVYTFHEQERKLLARISRELQVPTCKSLRELMEHLDAYWRDRLRSWCKRLADLARRLRANAFLSGNLSDAHARFMERWFNTMMDHHKDTCAYNARGVKTAPAMSLHMNQEI